MTDIAQLGIQVNSGPAVKAAADLEKLTVSAGKADAAADRLATNSGRIAPAMAGAGQGSRMLAMQLSQVAQQASATGNFVQALAIQLPDMAMGFGAAGIAAGVFASVALPALAGALFDGSQAAKTFDDVLADLEERMAAVNELSKVYSADGLTDLQEKYGEVTAELLAFIEAQRTLRMDEAMRSAAEIAAQLRDELGNALTSVDEAGRGGVQAIKQLTNELGITEAQARQLGAAYDQLRTAQTFEAQQTALTQIREILGGSTLKASEFYSNVVASEDAMRQLAASAADSGWLSGMISEAQTLAGSLWDAVSARVALVDGQADFGPDERGSQRGQRSSAGAYASQLAVRERMRGMGRASGGGGGGGGGGAADQYAADLEALVTSLETERETLDAWYAENQAILADRRAEEILGTQAHKDALLALEQEYQSRLSEIEGTSQQQRLSDSASFFGSLASIASAGGAKTAKAVAAFQAIEGTINAYGAAIKALNTPGISLAGRFAAYASVLAAGLKGVAAIRSAGGVGGGGGGAGAAIAAQGQQQQQQQVQTFMVKGIDRDALYTGDMLAKIFDGITEEAQKRGLQVGLRFI